MGHCAELRTTRPTPRRPMHKTARMWAQKPVGHIRPRGRAQLATLQLRPAQSGISCTEERRARRHHLHLYKTISAQSLLFRHLPYPEPGWGRGGGRPAGGTGMEPSWREEEAGPAKGALGEALRRPAFQTHWWAAAESAGVEAPVGPSHPPAVSRCRLRPGPAYGRGSAGGEARAGSIRWPGAERRGRA